MSEIAINDIPIETTQSPFNTFELTFGVYDHVVVQILFYMAAITLAIACVYLSAYMIKKLIGLFRMKR